MSYIKLITIIIFIVLPIGCGGGNTNTDIQAYTPSKNSFVMIHFESGYKGRLENDLPITIPQEYMVIDYGWQAYLFDTAKKLVQKADDYGFHLTLAFNPQWAEYIILDSDRVSLLKQWQDSGHEIAFHHHSLNHPDWNGYSNDPEAMYAISPFLGRVDAGLELVKNLAFPSNVSTAMIGGLPIDMPLSYESTTDTLILSRGNQFNSFDIYGDLLSLKPYKVIKSNGVEVIRIAHRQLTTISNDFTVEESLEIFKAEYQGTFDDEIYGLVFHCYDYHTATDTYDKWFEFIKSNGDDIQTINKVIENYKYEITTE